MMNTDSIQTIYKRDNHVKEFEKDNNIIKCIINEIKINIDTCIMTTNNN